MLFSSGWPGAHHVIFLRFTHVICMNILLAMYVCTPCVYLVPEIRGRHGTLGTELPKASGGPLQMFFMVLFCFVLVTASHYVTEIHPPLPLCLSLCLLSAGVKVVQHINALNWGGGCFSSPRYSMSSSLALNLCCSSCLCNLLGLQACTRTMACVFSKHRGSRHE